MTGNKQCSLLTVMTLVAFKSSTFKNMSCALFILYGHVKDDSDHNKRCSILEILGIQNETSDQVLYFLYECISSHLIFFIHSLLRQSFVRI
jgi:hypothetical protein